MQLLALLAALIGVRTARCRPADGYGATRLVSLLPFVQAAAAAAAAEPVEQAAAGLAAGGAAGLTPQEVWRRWNR